MLETAWTIWPYCGILTLAFVALVIPFDPFRGTATTDFAVFFLRSEDVTAQVKAGNGAEIGKISGAAGRDVRYGPREARKLKPVQGKPGHTHEVKR